MLFVNTPSNSTARPWSHFDLQTITLAIGRTPKGSTQNAFKAIMEGGLHSVFRKHTAGSIMGCTENSGFGVGHRDCLGRKFSEESVSMLVHLLCDYFLAPHKHGNADLERAGEKFSNGYVRLTLMPVQVPLVFTKRTPMV